MTNDDVVVRVAAHYAHDAGVLLLSDLGEDLRAAGLWPAEGESRQLYDVIDEIEGVSVVRDPAHKAYIVVVPAGREELAEQAIRYRGDVRLLRRLARVVLVAFCLDVQAPEQVYLRIEPPTRYAVSQCPLEEPYVLIEDQFRLPALLVEDVRGLTPEQTRKLAENVRDWASSHAIPIERLIPSPVKGAIGEPSGQNETTARAATALERLHSAQSSEVAARMIIPIDIALALSKMR